MECAHKVDSADARNEFDFVDESDPLMFEEGMSYYAGDAPSDDESEMSSIAPEEPTIIAPASDKAVLPTVELPTVELPGNPNAPPGFLMKKMAPEPIMP